MVTKLTPAGKLGRTVIYKWSVWDPRYNAWVERRALPYFEARAARADDVLAARADVATTLMGLAAEENISSCRNRSTGRFTRCRSGSQLAGTALGTPRSAASGFDVDRVLDAYVTTALWSSNDESTESGGEPLDRNYSASDLTAAAKARMRRDVVTFLGQARAEGVTYGAASDADRRRGHVEDHLGHDFWLTRNGHGAGFWDGDWTEPVAGLLDGIAKRMGEVSLYVSRKRIHHYPA